MASSADEIAKIEHELAILRERYALYQRGAEWVRRTLIAAGIVIAGLILWRIILGDVFGAILIVIICVIMLLGGIRYRRRRLIDIVSEIRVMPHGRSEAREIEEMIAQREKRLAELKARPA
jgi:hypothetical protein